MRLRSIALVFPCTLLVFACVPIEGEPEPALDTESTPIVGGSIHTGDPAVVFLSVSTTSEGGACSGTLISPRVVLTAAHCLDLGGTITDISAYFGATQFGSDDDFVERIDGVDHIYWPNWSLSAGDIGLVLLAREAVTPPREINRTVLGSGHVGNSLRLVGWGDTDGGAGDAGTKRQVTTTLAGFHNSNVLAYGTFNANTCQGDSGGPGFMTVGGQEVVASITSWGTGDCRGTSGGTRVARYAGWVDDWVATHDIRQAPEVSVTRPQDGATVESFFVVEADATDDVEVERVEMYVNDQPSGELTTRPYVFNAVDVPNGTATVEVRAYDNVGEMSSDTILVNVGESTGCDTDDDCPGAAYCDTNGMCALADGGLGDPCATNEDCDSGICATVSGESYCTDLCNLEVDDCPGGFTCTDAGGGTSVCIAADGGGAGGGCAAAGGQRGAGAGVLVLLALVVARRRRRG